MTAGHEMLERACPSSIRVPLLQLVPSKPKTRPMESTARQKVGVGHETPVSPDASEPCSDGSVATGTGALNAVPFHVSTSPALSTATQNVVLAQDTELSWPALSASPGWVQVLPSQTVVPPSTATQKVGETQEI